MTLMKPTDEIGRHLADDDLPRPQRRDEQRLHRAGFLFARQRDRGHQRRDDRQHERHQAGHEQVRALARRVESHPHRRHDPDLPRDRGVRDVALVAARLTPAARTPARCCRCSARWRPVTISSVRRQTARELLGEAGLEHDRALRDAALEQRSRADRIRGSDGDDLERDRPPLNRLRIAMRRASGAGSTIARRDAVDVGANRVAERSRPGGSAAAMITDERPPVAEDVDTPPCAAGNRAQDEPRLARRVYRPPTTIIAATTLDPHRACLRVWVGVAARPFRPS